MRTSLSLINCEIKSSWIKIGLHYLMLYSYIMCSDPSVNVLVLFFFVFTFCGIKFIILKLKLEINAWFFFSFFKKLVWILLLNFWNLKDLSFDFGMQSIYLKRVGSKKIPSLILCLVFLYRFCTTLVLSTKFSKIFLVMNFVCWIKCIYIFHLTKFNYMCHIIQAIVVLLSICKYTVSVEISLFTGQGELPVLNVS